MTAKINKELERELHVLDTALHLGRVLERDLPNAAPLLTRLATTGYLRAVARGMYTITADGKARHAAIGKELRAGATTIECELRIAYPGAVPAIHGDAAVPPGRYRAILERLP